MYTHTLSSISGDHLTIKPHDGKNITFEVSENNSVFIKRGDVSHNLSNLMAGLGGGGSGSGSTIGSGSDASLSNIDVSRNLNPLIVNGSSIGLATKNWSNAYVNTIYAETLNTYRGDKTLSLNSGTLLISGELLAQSTLNPLLTNRSSLGVSTNTWSNAYIRDLSAGSIELSGNILPSRDLSSNIGTSLRRLSTLAVDDLSINKINGQVYSASGPAIVLTSVSGDIIPVSANLFKLGDVTKNWGNAYLIDVSVSSIDVSLNLNPLLANRSSLGIPSKSWGNAYLRDASISIIDVSHNLNPLNANGSSLGLITRRWGNAYLRDVSASIIDVSLNLNPLLNNGSSLGVPGRTWGNAYIRDVSVSSIDVSSNLNPFSSSTSSLGLSTRRWGNAYIRDISVSSIDVSINSINPLLNNGSSLGLISKLWRNAYFRDLSAGNIDISTSLIPFASGSGGGAALSATGGTVTTSGAYTIHSFTTTGTSAFVPAFSGSVEVLIVGGGGGGGSNLGGGGGAGGVIWIPATNVISGTSYPVVVGTGGASGTSGIASSVFGATAAGGGTSGSWPSGSGTAGGSGGGAPANDGAINQGGGTSGNSLGTNNGTANVGTIYGNRGGHMTTGRTSGPTRAAGGGGAGGQGLDTNSNTTGDTGRTGMGSGGVGVVNAILGPSHYWGGGGGGASWDNQIGGYGGLGGGGGGGGAGSPTIGVGLGGGSALNSGANGSLGRDTNGGAGGANTGGGGGGGNHSSGQGGTGGSGIVVIRYLTSSGSGSTAISSLGLFTKYWGNAYIRDVSASAIELSGNIIPSINNTLSLGSALRRWNRVFVDNLNVSTINGVAYISGGGGGSGGVLSITSDMIPSITNTYDLGSTSRYWNNAYINNLRVSNRVYQEISGDISWSAVNGYYGLAKDAYPSLNPLSNGDKAVRTWNARNSQSGDWLSVCWSPQRRLFVAVAYVGTNRVMTSPNGIDWTARSQGVKSNAWHCVCWSPQLGIFVAVATTATTGTNNNVMTSPDGITWTERSASVNNEWIFVCWSAELGLFVATSRTGTNRVMTSSNGLTWSSTNVSGVEDNNWNGVCWSPELGIFVAVANSGNNRVMTSRNGINWTSQSASQNALVAVCWSPQLGIFVALSFQSDIVMTSSNGITWKESVVPEANGWLRICWCAEIRLFIAVAITGNNRVMTSSNGINWTSRTAAQANQWYSVCWSPELGIAVAVADTGNNRVMTSSLKGRPPTSYNVFDSSFNSIDETGKWTFQSIYSPTMTVQSANVNSDDRLKHNEVVITNGLDVIDKLNPKFYQKTLTLLDASYNGDLSGQSWSYEAGLIAQEVLQIPDLSFAVSGGDYYQETINYYDISYILRNQSNDISTNYYDPSTNYIKTANYDISYNLIKQPYALNYNSVFTYGIAAIKELHAKVKIQETTNLDDQLSSLIERIEALEHVAS
jgi:hypothetical protein